MGIKDGKVVTHYGGLPPINPTNNTLNMWSCEVTRQIIILILPLS